MPPSMIRIRYQQFQPVRSGNFDLLGREHGAVIGFNYGDSEVR